MKMRISNSQVGMWMRCPRQWEFRYIKGLKIPPKGVMVQGSAYHAALRANFENKIESGKDLDQRSVLDAFDKYWNENVGGKFKSADEEEEFETKDVDWEDKNPGSLKDDGYRLLKLYHKDIAPGIMPIHAEQEITKEIVPGTGFLGYIDLQTEDEIIDFKLKSRAINPADAERDSQPFSYCYLTGKKKFTFHAAIKKRLPEIQLVEVNKTEEDVEWWVGAVKQIIDQMKAGVCPPNWNGWWCGPKWCGYYDLCKAMR
jgi:putative RecB family exonuclease